MSNNLKLIIVGVVILAVGIAVGRMIGVAETYKKTSTALTDQYYRGATVNLRTHLALLELLHSNQEQKAAEKLENLVDVDIMALKRPIKEVMPQPPEVAELVKRAEDYRKAQRGKGQ